MNVCHDYAKKKRISACADFLVMTVYLTLLAGIRRSIINIIRTFLQFFSALRCRTPVLVLASAASSIWKKSLQQSRIILPLLMLEILFLNGCQNDSSTNTQASSRSLREIRDLINSFRNIAPGLRINVIIKLSQIGSPAVPDMLEACNDPDPRVRAGVILALGYSSPRYDRLFQLQDDVKIYPYVIRALNDKDDDVRASACLVLDDIARGADKADDAVGHLINLLNDPNNLVQYRAVASIGYLAPKLDKDDFAESAVKHFTAMLTDRDPELRSTVVRALGCFGADAKPALSSLVQLLADKDRNIRNEVVECLAELSSSNRDVLIALLIDTFFAAKRGDDEYRQELLRSLRRIPSLPSTITPMLVTMLEDKSIKVRKMAEIILGDMESDAHEAIPALRNVLKKRVLMGEKSTIAYALFRIDNHILNEVFPIFMAALKDPNSETREHAANILGYIGPPAKLSVPILGSLALTDPDRSVRHAADSALTIILRKN